MGSKNHQVVPTSLIAHIAKLRHGGVQRILNELAKKKLVGYLQSARCTFFQLCYGVYSQWYLDEGYRMTYGGYDYLALRAFLKRKTAVSVGNQIGVGKESDVYVVGDETGCSRVLKIQRLGRVSFRAVKSKRDYLQNRKSSSWIYLSRLAAAKEYAFMKVLFEHGFPVPQPFDLNRHCIVMELIDAFPLYLWFFLCLIACVCRRQAEHVDDVGGLHHQLMALIMRFAEHGLVHCDFNEFNLLLSEKGRITVIDFPQAISTQHVDARHHFERDVECIRAFFKRKFGFESETWPVWEDVEALERAGKVKRLDRMVAASGFSNKDENILSKVGC